MINLPLALSPPSQIKGFGGPCSFFTVTLHNVVCVVHCIFVLVYCCLYSPVGLSDKIFQITEHEQRLTPMMSYIVQQVEISLNLKN